MGSDDVFEAVSHPLRIEILKLLAQEPKRFADIKRELNIKSSGLLDFHLKKLDNLISVNSDGCHILNEKGFAALQAVETLSKYGWQKRAFYLNLLASIALNVYILLIDRCFFPIVLIVTVAWMALYGYWTFIKRHIPLKSNFKRKS